MRTLLAVLRHPVAATRMWRDVFKATRNQRGPR